MPHTLVASHSLVHMSILIEVARQVRSLTGEIWMVEEVRWSLTMTEGPVGTLASPHAKTYGKEVDVERVAVWRHPLT